VEKNLSAKKVEKLLIEKLIYCLKKMHRNQV